MRIDRNDLGKFIIVRGIGWNQYGFSFFVDDMKSSWTSKGFARQYATREEAVQDLQELRRRAKASREAGKRVKR